VDERTPELSVAVLPAYRGKGIGSHLVERLLQGVHATSLSCDPVNPAWRLYLRLGFEPLADGRTMLRMGVWGKGQQSLAPPQYTVAPEREQRSGIGDPCSVIDTEQMAQHSGEEELPLRSQFDPVSCRHLP